MEKFILNIAFGFFVVLGVSFFSISCSTIIGYNSLSAPPIIDDYSGSLLSLEAHIIKSGDNKQSWIDRNPTNNKFELSARFSQNTVGQDCCQLATVFVNGIPSGTKSVDTGKYYDVNYSLVGRIYPINFFKLKQDIAFSPFVIASIDYHKFRYNERILTNTGSHYDSPIYISKGFFQSLGAGIYFTPHHLFQGSLEGNVSFFVQHYYEFNKSDDSANLNGKVTAIGIRLY